MPLFRSLPRVTKAYLGCVVLVGTAAVLYSVYDVACALGDGTIRATWLILPLLTLFSGSTTVKIPSTPATLSVSEIFVLLAVLLLGPTGPAAGTVTVALDGLVISFWLQRKNPGIHRAMFNMAAPSISIWIASQLYGLVAALRLAPFGSLELGQVLAVVLLAAAYFLLNSFLIAFAISLETRLPALKVWHDNFLWLSLNYFGGASVAYLLAPGIIRGAVYTSLALIPILIISYLTYKTSMGRVEDAGRHIKQLNTLYLSTIETLATAIDAKDQITHGHIRRVQLYAVGLAKALGASEDALIKAIEAAALLHDTGKLAVPEYILNKPGKLTPAEFEKMKLHATVGADILSSIEFPYPVVPIVRHHHENWDGSGYPDGVKGPDIPIGARILAVVDCFDALTSDRPYRPALPDAEALRILLDRRGTWYDPLVVDMFLGVHAELSQAVGSAEQPGTSVLKDIVQSSRAASEPMPATNREAVAASSDEMLALYGLARSLGEHTSLADAGDIIAKHLRRIVPASLCVFYVYDADRDDLVAAHVAGSDPPPVAGMRIPRGERIAGWVAANRQTILNSDPALDFGDLARAITPRLRSCISTPLAVGTDLIGVLSLYACEAGIFTEDHRRIVEAVGRQISEVVRDSTQFERTHSALTDTLTGLPNLERLKQLMPADAGLLPVAAAQPLSLLFVDIDRLKQINEQAGRAAGDAVLAYVASVIRRVLRGADILFRYAGDEFVVLLSQTDADTAESIAERVRSGLASAPYVLADGRSMSIVVTIGVATHPADGSSLTDLIAVARHRLIPGSLTSAKTVPGVH